MRHDLNLSGMKNMAESNVRDTFKDLKCNTHILELHLITLNSFNQTFGYHSSINMICYLIESPTKPNYNKYIKTN